MPEGPEVRKIVDQLRDTILDRVIVNTEILSGRYKTHGAPSGFQEYLERCPLLIKDINCKGKFIYFTCQDVDKNIFYIWNTLGMSGGWAFKSTSHSRLKFSFLDGTPIHFQDMRNFGTLHFVSSQQEMNEKLNSLGPDLLQEVVSDSEFKSRLLTCGSYKTISEVLMDQSVFSGVGNYLKAEALYVAKIAPTRKVSTLNDEEFSALNKAIQVIIRESYKTGGSTFRVYQDLYGQTGNYSERFMVYGRKSDPQGNQVSKIKTKDGRTTHWVPAIQK
jgi:formamidopyrimidine-DNA glycosylase